jgi:hypothetical protein
MTLTEVQQIIYAVGLVTIMVAIVRGLQTIIMFFHRIMVNNRQYRLLVTRIERVIMITDFAVDMVVYQVLEWMSFHMTRKTINLYKDVNIQAKQIKNLDEYIEIVRNR